MSVTEKVVKLREEFEKVRVKFESDVWKVRRSLVDSIVVRSMMTGKYSGMMKRLVSLSDESCYATTRMLFHAVSPRIRIEMCDGFCLPSELNGRARAMVDGSSLELRKELTAKLVRVVECCWKEDAEINSELWNLMYLELVFEK